jgi:putative heme-binding domain-containing protein
MPFPSIRSTLPLLALVLAPAAAAQLATPVYVPPPAGYVGNGGNNGNPGNPNPPQTRPEDFDRLGAVNPQQAAAALAAITVPDEFEVKVFATPPVVNYPVAIAAAPDGRTLFVAVDGNGSLSANEHMGRILRVRDTSGDGVADEVKAFVPDINSPRGVVWNHDHLIVLAPPNVTAFYDRDGDGVADYSKILVSGVGFTLRETHVDHGQNGIEAGIDGWIYFACGDQGFHDAIGSDGRHLQLHGGGVVRFRPDGSGLELWAKNTRNIGAVALGPKLEGFARDNTNDGGGWDIRFHYFSGMTDHGYPSLFLNSPDEVIKPINEFGGGSGVGATWIEEPGIPAKWNNAPFTADWGRATVYYQKVTVDGANYKLDADDRGNEPFISVVKPMDLDGDAMSNIFLSTWGPAQFNWIGPNSGMIYRISPKGYTAPPLPDYDTLNAAGLLAELQGPSAHRRLEAQRAILRRPAVQAAVTPLLEGLMADKAKDTGLRVAGLFTYRQMRGAASTPVIGRLLSDPTIAPWALRALGDDRAQARTIPVELVQSALKSGDPRIRNEAIITLTRAESTQSIPAIAPLLADSDYIVWHTAVESLRTLKAVDVPLAILDAPASSPELRRGALQVLEAQHDARVVAALGTRAARETNPENRLGLIGALGRLANVEAEWNGTWWTPRPVTTGPYYQAAPWAQTQNAIAAINSAVDKAGPEETVKIGLELQRQGVPAGAAAAKFVAFADAEPKLLPAIASYYATADSVPANAIPVLVKMARATTTTAADRALALNALVKTDSRDAWDAVIPTLQTLQAAPAAGGGRGGGRGGAAPAAAPAAAPGATLSAAQTIVATALVETPAATLLQNVVAARNAVLASSLAAPANQADLDAKAAALAAAEQALADARAVGFARVQSSVLKLTTAQIGVYAAQQATATPPAAAAAGGRGGGGRGGAAAAASPGDTARAAVLNAPKLEVNYQVFVDQAAKVDGAAAQIADSVLLNLASRKVGSTAAAAAAGRALDAGWANPQRRVQIMLAAAGSGDASRALQFAQATTDADAGVAQIARYALQQLNLNADTLRAEAAQPKISSMSVDAVLAAVTTAKGTVTRGQQLATQLGCAVCHTFSASEPLKGPFLGAIASIQRRRDIAENILVPNKSLAQGFTTNLLELRNGTSVTGFIVNDASDALTVRNIAAQEQRIAKADITKRTLVETSMMPAGLVNDITVTEFASLLDYLESLAQK